MITELLRISKQKKMDRKDVTGGKYVKDKTGYIKVNDNEIMNEWKVYFMVLLNEHNDYEIDESAKTIEGNHRE